MNWIENRFKLINFSSVRFFSFPNRFKPKLFRLSFFWAFYWSHFSALLFLYLLSFYKKSTPIFILIDPCPEVKLSKKYTKTKGKERKELIKLQKNKEKIKSYWNIKSSKNMEKKKTDLRDERQSMEDKKTYLRDERQGNHQYDVIQERLRVHNLWNPKKTLSR